MANYQKFTQDSPTTCCYVGQVSLLHYEQEKVLFFFYFNMPISRDQTQLLFYVGKMEVNIYCLIRGCVNIYFL